MHANSMESLRENYRGVFDSRVGFGHNPAVLVIDLIRAYTTPDSPLYAEDVVVAAKAVGTLLRHARQKGILVVYTRVLYSESGIEGGLFVEKVPVLRGLQEGNPLASFIDALQPEKQDVVITKHYASAFFGTALASILTARGIDTLILTGCSTSGCVRATAVDGMQHGFRVIVPRECVGDRATSVHDANLFDIDSKYGDVVSLAYVMERV